MKLILIWILNYIITLPFKMIKLIIKTIYSIIKTIYFNNFDLEYINNLDGFEFEAFTKILLEKNNFKNVTVSKRSGDYGIDVLALKNGYLYTIQCKRYNHQVGIKAVQEANSGCTYYHGDIPVVFTNSTFSKAAISLAKSTEVELWDYHTLCYFLKKSGLLSKSLPFYYPLISIMVTATLGYLYFKKQILFIPLVISIFLLISIFIKIIKTKIKASSFQTKLN